MSLRYIIDGNNVLHHPDFTCPKHIADRRNALSGFILKHRLTGSRKNKVVIVFDGHPSLPPSKDGSTDNTEIIFSRNESADQGIRRILEKTANPKNTVVVSDDKEIMIFTRLFGARHLGVDEFIRRKAKAVAPSIALKPELTYTQIQRINRELRQIWLK